MRGEGDAELPPEALEYLKAHGIHELINELAHAVLTEKPADPRRFLARLLEKQDRPDAAPPAKPPAAPPAKDPAPPTSAPAAPPAPPPAPAKAPAPPPAPASAPAAPPAPAPAPAKTPAPPPAPKAAPAPPSPPPAAKPAAAAEAAAKQGDGGKAEAGKDKIKLREEGDWVEYWQPSKGKAYYLCRPTKKTTYNRADTPFTTDATPPDAAQRSSSVQSGGSNQGGGRAPPADKAADKASSSPASPPSQSKKAGKVKLREEGDWVEYWLADKGKAYYTNKATKESTWKIAETPFKGAPTPPS
eukprot:TRINITY_DN50001_c0_g1_i1.p2 TRINITY_DN50001_c0_g1~~TRINITY_DN50001_c0_g1_i1.p2  ORF type:complete len:301 (+),score=75.15 TRINITY_DN50001_c0_g1_i1:70-972(+)